MSFEYKWTSEQILKLTLREISWRLENINKRRQTDVKLQAKLHNMEFKHSSNSDAVYQNSPEEMAKIEIAKKAFIERTSKR